MKAAFLVAPGQIDVRDIPEEEPAPGEVAVRIRVALTDGTDLKAYRRGHPKMRMPTRFGHEFSGDVVAVGEGVRNFSVGDAIACVHTAPCGNCYWCMVAQEELCPQVIDRMLLGSYAESIIVPAHIVEKNAFQKPVSLSYEAAAFLEPLGCVMHAWEQRPNRTDAVIAIIGVGGFGLLHAFAARALGYKHIILLGRRPEPLAFAKMLGVAQATASLEEDALLVVHELTEGRGADMVIECTGSQAVWERAPSYARRGGMVVLFGGLPSAVRVAFDAGSLHYDEVRLLSPFHLTPRSVAQAFRMLVEGSVDPRPLITAPYALADIAQAFAHLDAGRGVKYAIRPEDPS